MGSILALGVDIAGPGGSGPAALECSLVLASNFEQWLKRLESCDWTEYGLVPGELSNLSEPERIAHRLQFSH